MFAQIKHCGLNLRKSTGKYVHSRITQKIIPKIYFQKVDTVLHSHHRKEPP